MRGISHTTSSRSDHAGMNARRIKVFTVVTNNPDTVTATAILRKEKAQLCAAGRAPVA